MNLHVIKKRNHFVNIVNLLINHSGCTSTNTMCQVFFFSMLPHYFTMYIAFWVALPRHSWDLYGELSFGFPSGAAALGPNILWSTPLIQKSTKESTSMVSPPMPKIVCVWQTCDGSVRVSSRCGLHKNCVQARHDVQANAQVSPHIKGTGKHVILPCCKILVPQWELVPCFSWALP